MDDKCTTEARRCAWRSALTGLFTPWHGTWHAWRGGLKADFDCKGRHDGNGLVSKFASLSSVGEENIVGKCPEYHGKDYRGRSINASTTQTWFLDRNSASFLLAPPTSAAERGTAGN